MVNRSSYDDTLQSNMDNTPVSDGGKEEQTRSVSTPIKTSDRIEDNKTPSSATSSVGSNASSTPVAVNESIHGPSGVETIYELARSPLESPASHVVSERVQTLASQIYNELQKIMTRCADDEEVVSGLMPLVVNVLESLDLSLIENQQLQVELELCKDDNEQLVAAFEKEKTYKKKIDQKMLEIEFQADEEKQSLQQKVESLESIVKILELKSKNSTDHCEYIVIVSPLVTNVSINAAMRLEEKEAEQKQEYNKLHTRYTELLRSHCDLMERVKILIGNEDFSNSTSGPGSLTASNALRIFLTRKMEMDQTLEKEQVRQDKTKGESEESSQNAEKQKQIWLDAELSLEDASIIEDVEDIPKDREPPSLTGLSPILQFSPPHLLTLFQRFDALSLAMISSKQWR